MISPSLWKSNARVIRQNEKAMFAMELMTVWWERVYRMDTCEEKFRAFEETVSGLIDKHFPEKLVKIHEKDKPWITDQFRTAVRERRKAWSSGRMEDYRRLRNKVNHMNHKLRASFYIRKVRRLQELASRKWWQHMKSLMGLNKTSSLLQRLANAQFDGCL